METFITLVKCSSLRKKDCIIVNFQPYKIKSLSVTKVGIEGKVKIDLAGINLLNKNKYNDMYLGSNMILRFRLKEKDYKVLSMDSNMLNSQVPEGNLGIKTKDPFGILVLKCSDDENIKEDIFLDENSEIYNNIKRDFDKFNITISTRFLPIENDISVCLDSKKIQLYTKDEDKEKYIK